MKSREGDADYQTSHLVRSGVQSNISHSSGTVSGDQLGQKLHIHPSQIVDSAGSPDYQDQKEEFSFIQQSNIEASDQCNNIDPALVGAGAQTMTLHERFDKIKDFIPPADVSSTAFRNQETYAFDEDIDLSSYFKVSSSDTRLII